MALPSGYSVAEPTTTSAPPAGYTTTDAPSGGPPAGYSVDAPTRPDGKNVAPPAHPHAPPGGPYLTEAQYRAQHPEVYATPSDKPTANPKNFAATLNRSGKPLGTVGEHTQRSEERRVGK